MLIGHASSGQVSQELLSDGDKYCRRLKYVTELSNQWWNLWITQFFPSLLPFKSWTRRQRNLEVDNIALVQTKVKLGKDSYRMACVVETHPDEAGLVRHVTLEARPRGGPLGLPYKSKKLEKFEMAVQRLVLIHPREFEIPTVKDIDPIANMKALLEDSKKAQDVEVKNIIEEEKENNIEDDVSDDNTLEIDEPQDT